MKKITFKSAFLAAVALFGMNMSANAQVTLKYPDSTPDASFTTIQAAYNAIDFTAHAGAHIIQIDATPSAEVYPITLGALTDASATNKVTIKPATGAKIVLGPTNQTVIASAVSFASGATSIDLAGKITNGDISQISTSSYVAGIGVYASAEFKKVASISGTTLTLPSGTITAASGTGGNKLFFGPGQTCAIKFNGAKYVTIDGVSRTDLNTGLTIQNPNSIFAQTIFFAGNSQYNTVTNCILRGANHSGAWNNGWQGTVFFQAGTGFTCSYNTIDNNDICDMGDQNIPYPIAAIQMTAAGGTNTNQTISNNNIYNISNQYAGNGTCTFMQFGSESAAVGHNVLNNKFFWTGSTTFSSASINFINCGTLGLGHRFEGNTIGYTSATGTGTADLTFLGSGGTIYGTSNPKNFTCKNNTIANLKITGPTGTKAFVALQIAVATAGSENADNCLGNTIQNIELNSNGGNGTLYGILIPATPIFNIDVKNNIIKNLTCQSATATYTNTIYGISHNFSSSYTINVTTTAGSAAATITGGSSLASGMTYTISNANIPAATTFTYSGSSSITLSNAATTAGTGVSATAIAATPANINLIGNEISNLTAGNSGSSAANVITAVVSGGCSNIYEKNLIYSLNTISTGTGSLIKALRFATSKASGITVKNNIIRLGSDVTSNAEISAIIDEGLSSNGHPFYIYHNSVFIGGGTGLTLTKPSHCFNHSAGANYGSIIIKNNIFCNARVGGAVNQIYNTMSLPVLNASSNNLYKYGSLFATVTTTTPATYASLDD